MPLAEIPYEHLQVVTDDGVVLAVQIAGEGPPVLLANGIGVSYPGLGPIVEHLYGRHQVVLWDYRGIGNSPTTGRKVDYSMHRHARDALQVVDALELDRVVALGWSMGVPVGLELCAMAPERVAGFGALFGAAGPAFRAGFPAPVAALFAGVSEFSRHFTRPARMVLNLACILPSLTQRILSLGHFVGVHADPEVFASQVRGVAEAPKEPYFSTMLALADHDARDVLPRLRCPTLVVGGGRDWLTPPRAAREMADATPGARLVIIPNATHFGLIEEMAPLLSAIDHLLRDAFPR